MFGVLAPEAFCDFFYSSARNRIIAWSLSSLGVVRGRIRGTGMGLGDLLDTRAVELSM